MLNITFIKRVRPENDIPDGLNQNEIFHIKDWEDFNDYNSRVVLLTTAYAGLFNRTRRQEGYQSKKGIVKVINTINGRVIYRQYYGQNGIHGNEACMTTQSMNELGIRTGNVNLAIDKTCFLWGRVMYFWKHPDLEVRVPAKIALLSILIGVIAIPLAVISIWLTVTPPH